MACFVSKSTLRRADINSTSNMSGCLLITSKVCVPIDPVEPSIAILLFLIQYNC